MRLDTDTVAAIAAEVCDTTGARVVRPWALAAVAGACEGVIGVERVGSSASAADAVLLLQPLDRANGVLAQVVRGVAEK